MDKLLYFPNIDEFGQRTSRVLNQKSHDFEKVADSRDYAEPIKEFLTSVTPDTEKYLYMLLHALGAYEYWGSNVNGDAFEEWALKHDGPEYGHKTFETGAKLYKHHVNKDPEKSYGDVLYSNYDDKMNRVLLVVTVNRQKAPDICRRIEVLGEYPDVSMGCKVPYDICSICGHQAKSPQFYCDHAKYEMNRIYPDGKKVFVYNPFPRFFDISQVFIGAEKPAKFLHKIASADMGSNPESYRKDNNGFYIPSAIFAEKVGYSTKSADMIKEVPTSMPEVSNRPCSDMVMDGVSQLRKHEKLIPTEVIGHLADFPIKEVLSTLTSMGITLSPEEFQQLVLVRNGEKKLASVLRDKNIVFKHSNEDLEVDPIELSSDDVNPEIQKIASTFMESRSDSQPFLLNRILETNNKPLELDERITNPSKINVAPTLMTASLLYMAYKKGLLNAIGSLENVVKDLSVMTGADKLKNPAMIIPISAVAASAINGAFGAMRSQGVDESILKSDILKTASARDLALVSGLSLAPYVAREHVINKAQRGERPGLMGSLLYKYPEVASTAAFLSAPIIASKARKLKQFADNKIIGRIFKSANLKSQNVHEWLEKSSCQHWGVLYENVIKNRFWENDKLAHIPARVSNVLTIIGLAELGSKEE